MIASLVSWWPLGLVVVVVVLGLLLWAAMFFSDDE